MSEISDLHVHDGLAYEHKAAFCPITRSECRGDVCAMAIHVKDVKGWKDYLGGYRCGLIGVKLTSPQLYAESYTTFDGGGQIWR